MYRMLIVFAASSLGAVGASAADTAPLQAQWEPTQLSMFELVGKGFRIVSAQTTTTEDSSGGQRTDVYYLQNTTDVYKCSEVAVTALKPFKMASFIHCWHLVAPYLLPASPHGVPK